MRVQVAKWGNSAALRLPKSVVAELNLRPGREVDLTVVDGEARIRAVEPLRGHALLMELLAECDRIGWDNQPPLEDWSSLEAPWPSYNEDEKPT